MSRCILTAFLLLVLLSPLPAADEVPPNQQYLEFIRKQAAELRKNDKPPATKEEWEKQEAELRKNLFAAWGGTACFPEKPCDLDPQLHGEPLKRDGYVVEKITFQTRSGVRMTANLYIPDAARKKPAPAILQVHGHWKGAKQDPVVQSRCIGAAKLGFVVLCVDAFGAGERGVGTRLGEYHGDMTAATLLPLGLPLSGLQVYENMRAVDYLETRPEVDKEKIGITGASGGGNQTMYAGAWDKRFKCVVPVCSVGNYQAYLGQACCMCEVVPGALRFTEEWGVLALTAPRPLMVVNATKDAIQFSVGEAKKSLALTAPVYGLLGKPDHLRHAIFDGPHDYSKAMREAMYGFMTLHLKGEGNGDPIPEPAIKTENPEDLRCYPGDTRPKDFMTIPKFAAREGKKVLELAPQHAGWQAGLEVRRKALVEKTLGSPATPPPGFDPGVTSQRKPVPMYYFQPEPGLELSAGLDWNGKPIHAVILNMAGGDAARASPLAAELRKRGWEVLTLNLRATGDLAPPNERVGRAPDHNSAEWGLWIGRPLLGQWVYDVRRLLDQLDRRGEIVVIGEGPAGLVALCAAATDKRITRVATVNTLASFVAGEPYAEQRLGVLASGILRDVGDVAHLAALCAPKDVLIAGGVSGGGKALTGEELAKAYERTSSVFKLLGKERQFVLTTSDNVLKGLGLTPPSEK